MLRFLAALVVLLWSCGTEEPRACESGIPRQCEAEDIVWYEGLGRHEDPPTVEWDTTSTCNGVPGIYDPWSDRCTAGLFYLDWWHAKVVYPPATISLADLAYAHEYMHAALYLEHGDADGEHKRKDWCSRLAGINQRLRDAGL